jgi:hypothetical protein
MFFQLFVLVSIVILGFSVGYIFRILGKNHGNGKAPDSKNP